jgi:uncharacterized protein (DUF58 family)
MKKSAVSAEFVAVLARLLTRHGNPVGAMLYGDQVEPVIPAGSGRRQVLRLLGRMLARPAAVRTTVTNLNDLFQAAVRVVRRRSLLFVLSDFISAPGWEQPLALLAQRHEVLAVRLFDPLELEWPDLGLLLIRDAETGEQAWVDTHDRGFRKRFAAAAQRRQEDLRWAFQKAGVDALELSTSDDIVDAIRRFADLRRQRLRGSAAGSLPQHLGGRHGVSVA